MTDITATTQLNTFSIIKNILLTNSTLNKKFNSTNIFEFEPNLKSLTTKDLPYIVIMVPNTDTDLMVLSNANNLKTFTVPINLVMDYTAKDNVSTYASNIVRSLETAKTTFNTYGYRMPVIESQGSAVEILDMKQVIRSDFELTLIGNITR